MDTLLYYCCISFLFCHFTKGKNFCDFEFATLDKETLPKRCYQRCPTVIKIVGRPGTGTSQYDLMLDLKIKVGHCDHILWFSDIGLYLEDFLMYKTVTLVDWFWV